MRIVLVTYLFPPFHGGVADAVAKLSLGLARRGHDVIVYTTRMWKHAIASNDGSNTAGLQVKRILGIAGIQILYGLLPNPIAIRRELRVDKPDVVNIHGVGHLENDYISQISKDSAIVLTGHGGKSLFDRPGRPKFQLIGWAFYEKTILKRTVSRINRVIALSEYEIPYWHSLGVPNRKIDIIPWGVGQDCYLEHDGSTFERKYETRHPIILSVGSLVVGKGQEWLVRSLPKIVKRFPDATCVLCGPDLGYGTALKNLAEALGVSQNLRITGYLSRKELMQAYSACDVFVSPSDFEGFGLATMEAAAFGKPIVATNVGAIPYLLPNGKSALLVPQRDDARIAEAVLQVLANPELGRRLSQSAKEKSLAFKWDEVIQKYEESFVKALMLKNDKHPL
jgi:glycosyltransferase involved in cell wall biosynthesis